MATSPPPNLVIILTDQLRPFELGCHGHPVVRTPNIERLAARGMRFEMACTPNPLCTPGRSGLISGQYPRTCIGMLGNVGEPAATREQFPEPTLPDLLRKVGYEMASVGAWHLGPHPRLFGFDQSVFFKVYHRNMNQTYDDDTGRSWMQPGFAPEFELKTTREFLTQPRSRPFFLYHNISLPHMPYFDVPERFRQMYSPRQAHIRPNACRDGKLVHDEHWFKIYYFDAAYYVEKQPDCQELPAGFDLHALTAMYYGMIACVDWQVGELLRQLDEAGMADNTVIIFTSDHGDNLGSHGLFNKLTMNEESIRVPLLVSGPGVVPGRANRQQMASLVDVAPTALALCGQPVPDHMQGRNLAPILTGAAETVGESEAFIEGFHGEMAVRTPTHSYAVLTETQRGTPQRKIVDERHQFYDLRDDPYQMRNLAKTDEQVATAAELRRRVLDWDRRTPWMAGSLGGPYGHGP